jgi:hypothetical protein
MLVQNVRGRMKEREGENMEVLFKMMKNAKE